MPLRAVISMLLFGLIISSAVTYAAPNSKSNNTETASIDESKITVAILDGIEPHTLVYDDGTIVPFVNHPLPTFKDDQGVIHTGMLPTVGNEEAVRNMSVIMPSFDNVVRTQSQFDVVPPGPDRIIGNDDRVPVTDSTQQPWRMTVRIAYTNPNNTTGWCSGFIYDDNTVATAAHCLYPYNDTTRGPNDFVKKVTITPGQNTGNSNGRPIPFPGCNGIALAVPAEWMRDGNVDFDWGTVKLDCAIGDVVGTYGLFVITDQELAMNPQSNLVGYPSDKGLGTSGWGKYMYFSTSNVNSGSSTAYRIAYDNDMVPGDSGAPVWRGLPPSCNYCVYAINSYEYFTGIPNFGVRITQPVFAALKTAADRGFYVFVPLVRR